MNLLDALRDPKLFAPLFPSPEWDPWSNVLAGVYGLPPPDPGFFTQHAQREPPTTPCRTFVAISGRRSGKSRIASLLCAWTAIARDYRKFLAPGEWADILLFAVDTDQAGVLLSFTRGIFEAVPMLARELGAHRSKDTLVLPKRRVRIQVKAGNFRSVRGRSVVLAALDEAAFLRSVDESSLSAEELVTALRPSLATIPGSMLVAIGSPYARRGWFHEQYAKHYGKDGDTLVWLSGTRDMNASIPQSVIDDALAQDPIAAAAEWFGTFRRDVEGWLSPEALQQCVVPGRLELPPRPGVQYIGALDPSGGHSDSFTMAVAHHDAERGVTVLDALRERKPPFSPSDVCAEFAALLKAYGIGTVTADRYAGEWVVEQMARVGVHVEQNAAPKSDVYMAALASLNSGTFELLDLPRLHSQLLSLERRTARGGKDSVDHPPGAHWHDDAANAACLALVSVKPTTSLVLGANLSKHIARVGINAPASYERELFERADRFPTSLRDVPRPQPFGGHRRYGS